MPMAATDLVHLIDLSLGTEPCGVVNFNYLHGLLHEIVKRLVEVESSGSSPLPVLHEGSQPSEAQEGEDSKEPEEDAGKQTAVTPSPVRRAGSGYLKSRSSYVAAANDLGALDRKIQELENRLNTMETLPELLERKSSDSQATPISDMWNFTNLNKRIGAAEEGLDKSFKLIDDLLGEVQSLKEQVDGFSSTVGSVNNKLSGDLKLLESKVKDLEGLKLAAAKDSMGDAAGALLAELAGKIEAIQAETEAMKATVGDLDPSVYITHSELQGIQDTLSQHEEILQRHESTLNAHEDSLSATETALQESRQNIGTLEDKVGSIREEMDKLIAKIQEIEASLSSKVNISDLSSLMPQGSGTDDGGSLMPKLIEIQSKLSQMESQLPSDLLDKISAMQKAIDGLQAELASLSSMVGTGADDHSKLEELGSLVAQLRERMSDLDRAVTAIGNAVSKAPREGPLPDEEADGASKYVDTTSFEALQELLEQVHQEQERLIGTAAHLSHELDISKEHVKSLYGGVDELRDTKADKELLEVEVRSKADRQALDNKASREWVDSTFERLDKEIRDARSKMLGQEEALKSALHQLEEDVEGKLDRMELQPLKDYFDKKLDRVKPAAPVPVEEAFVDDAAGFRKPLRFRCISCDKPVGVKPLTAVPALPSGGMFPETRSFRPYTTYELELIRNHQKMGSPLPGTVLTNFPRNIRSAGGSHTMTRPHQRIRVAPLGSGHTPDSTHSVPPTRNSPATVSPSIHDELEIIGQDGHIYKGRTMARTRLPPLAKVKHGRSFRPSRPSTSPMQPSVTT